MPRRYGTARSIKRSVRKSGKRRIKHIESQVQRDCVNFFRSAIIDGRAFLFAVPNGEKRNPFTAKLLKEMGVEAGVSDLILIGENRTIVFLEAKRPPAITVDSKGKPKKDPGGKQSEHQENFQKRVEAYGFHYRMFDSLNSFIKILHEFGILKR